jgi:hypothetical protein
MSTYTPDTWVVLEFDAPELETPLRKVFAGWYGGYIGSDSWRLNSGITQVRRSGDWFEFDGYSGSTYHCGPGNYHMSGLMHGVLDNWLKQADQRGDTHIRVLTLEEVCEMPYNIV